MNSNINVIWQIMNTVILIGLLWSVISTSLKISNLSRKIDFIKEEMNENKKRLR